MSDDDYNRISEMTAMEIAKLGAWELVRFMERCGRVRRLMILQLLSAQRS